MCMLIMARSQTSRLHDCACNAMLCVQHIIVHIDCLWWLVLEPMLSCTVFAVGHLLLW